MFRGQCVPVETLYSSSTGAFRSALDLLLRELRAARGNPEYARHLALVAQHVAQQWCRGATADELAALVFVEVGS